MARTSHTADSTRNPEHTILPYVAHMAAERDARRAMAESDCDGLLWDQDAFMDGKYDSLVDEFLYLADCGVTPTITDCALAIYEHAYQQAWLRQSPGAPR